MYVHVACAIAAPSQRRACVCFFFFFVRCTTQTAAMVPPRCCCLQRFSLTDRCAILRLIAQWFREKPRAFEWYGTYKDIAGILRPQLARFRTHSEPGDGAAAVAAATSAATPAETRECRILVPGCGNSNLSRDLYDSGRVNIVNIDFSAVVVKQLCAEHAMRVRAHARRYAT